MNDTPNVISTILYTEADVKVNQQVEVELKVPDPNMEAATAAIQESKVEPPKRTLYVKNT